MQFFATQSATEYWVWNLYEISFNYYSDKNDFMLSIIKTLYRPPFWETSTNFSFTAAAVNSGGPSLVWTHLVHTIPGIVEILNHIK